MKQKNSFANQKSWSKKKRRDSVEQDVLLKKKVLRLVVYVAVHTFPSRENRKDIDREAFYLQTQSELKVGLGCEALFTDE